MTITPYDIFHTEINGFDCYIAGYPRFPRNFSRDGLYAGLIANDAKLLHTQIEFSTKHQGSRYDPLTGEEPGKIHHELPGVAYREGLYTTYNACDTTSLFIIACDALSNLEQVDDNLLVAVSKAVEYILSHAKDNIFWEYPIDGSEKYSLRVTYWKDSVIPTSTGMDDPSYPISYALAHFQAAQALLCASRMLDDESLRETSDRMITEGINRFMRDDFFISHIDGDGEHSLVSSDEIHCLLYIPTTYKNVLPIEAMTERALELFSSAGIACVPKTISDEMVDDYHGYVVWPFEQALLHRAATTYDLTEIVEVTKRCIPFIKSGHEVIYIDEDTQPRSNDRQLWSIAAQEYFKN